MIILHDYIHELTSLPSGSPLFDPLDELSNELSFDRSFLPHIKWGPWSNVRIAEITFIESYDDNYVWANVQFDWDDWEFQLELCLLDGHDCPSCKCTDDLSSRIFDELEQLEYALEDIL